MNLNNFRSIKEKNSWSVYAISLLNEDKFTSEFIDSFGTYWIEAGHHMREQIADDRVLVRLLRHILPPYEGEAMELYRGENLKRWNDHAPGLAWTPNKTKAQMFGSGLNAVISGGVLLRATFKQCAIISAPNHHSKYLGEEQFTIDPFVHTEISAIEFFPKVD
jgi:hypothetical protein